MLKKKEEKKEEDEEMDEAEDNEAEAEVMDDEDEDETDSEPIFKPKRNAFGASGSGCQRVGTTNSLRNIRRYIVDQFSQVDRKLLVEQISLVFDKDSAWVSMGSDPPKPLPQLAELESKSPSNKVWGARRAAHEVLMVVPDVDISANPFTSPKLGSAIIIYSPRFASADSGKSCSDQLRIEGVAQGGRAWSDDAAKEGLRAAAQGLSLWRPMSMV